MANPEYQQKKNYHRLHAGVCGQEQVVNKQTAKKYSEQRLNVDFITFVGKRSDS